jgi:hypothetical protein
MLLATLFAHLAATAAAAFPAAGSQVCDPHRCAVHEPAKDSSRQQGQGQTMGRSRQQVGCWLDQGHCSKWYDSTPWSLGAPGYVAGATVTS